MNTLATVSAALLTLQSCAEAPDSLGDTDSAPVTSPPAAIGSPAPSGNPDATQAAAADGADASFVQLPYIAGLGWTFMWNIVVNRDLRICITMASGATGRANIEQQIRDAVWLWTSVVSPVSTVPLHQGVVFTNDSVNADYNVLVHPASFATSPPNPFPDPTVDPIFRTRPYTWSPAGVPYTRLFDDSTGPVVVHEFGHAFGLGDTYVEGGGGICKVFQPQSIMCSGTSITADDVNGMRQAFGNAEPLHFNRTVGFYPIKSAGGAPGKPMCLDVKEAGTANGTAIQVYECGLYSNQVWNYDPTTKRIRSEHSGKCLDVWGVVPNDTAAVKLHDCHNGLNQQWDLYADGTIREVQSGKCLDVAGGTVSNGITLQIYPCLGTPTARPLNQRWLW
jgi:hypothetical protein